MDIPLTAELHREGDWFVAFCPEVPEANGQGRSEHECLQSLRAAILLLMEDRREDARKRLKDEAALLTLA
jgi:predicted RNase H-like HicB family nuclease